MIAKRIALFLKRNLWVLLLDVISVNGAYYAALLIRFFVHNRFDKVVYKYMFAFYRFAPFYTVACLIVFFLAKLYNGMWRYAGLNDMNRVIGANALTAVIQVLGTLLFVRRMPLTYYAIGAALQFVCVAFTRFIYRFYLIERKKIAARRAPSINVLIIGANEMGRRVIRNLAGNSALTPVCFLENKGEDSGKSFDGIPVFGLEELSAKIAEYKVRTVLITDNSLTDAQRGEIREKCAGVELVDYTGYMNNSTGAVSLTALLEMAGGPVTIRVGGEETRYENGAKAIQALHDRYSVSSVGAQDNALIVALEKVSGEPWSGYEEWAKKYKEETGEDVSFF